MHRWSSLLAARLAAHVLSVWVCGIGASAFAADEGAIASSYTMPSSHASGLSLRLDSALLDPAAVAAAEDCDEPGNLLAQGTASLDTQLLTLNSPPAGHSAIADLVAPIQASHPASASHSRSASTAAVVPAPVQTWEIAPNDKTLNAALARWAASAGWQLVWDVPVDYAVETRTSVPGTFTQAVEVVTKSMATAEIPLKAIFYDGNKVLRIVARGAE